jgi:chromosome segregation ATPase
MARPLPTSEPSRGGSNGSHHDDLAHNGHGANGHAAGADELQELEHLRAENDQLRTLCVELEQALQEATSQGGGLGEDRAREYEALLEEKSEGIRALHLRVQELQAALADAEAQAAEAAQQAQANPHRSYTGPAPREEELLALSEELERERRQLQEDEHTLMEQMREMEVGMARERAEMARQRNDLQRLQGEIRHELERLERNGALQSKIDNLKNRFNDATNRRGAAPGQGANGNSHAAPGASGPANSSTSIRREGIMGRLFGQGGR